MTDKPDLGADGPAALARLSSVATYRGKTLAKQVASTPLEQWHVEGRLSQRQYEAGQRLAKAYQRASLTATSLAAPARYISSDSDLDEDTDGETPEQQYARRVGYSRLWTGARDHLGQSWHFVKVCICEGEFPYRDHFVIGIAKSLEKLADLWKIPK